MFQIVGVADQREFQTRRIQTQHNIISENVFSGLPNI